MAEPAGKVVFADQLRGIAALVVVFSHMFNSYPFAQSMVSGLVAAPQVEVPNLWITIPFTQPWINFGPFGVGLFFLVSGFVIPFSLRRHNRGSFLLARALRIYPTYAAALAIGCLFVVASARFWHRPVPFGWGQFWANAELLHVFRGYASLDQVNWTLVIELHFYLFAALARPWILRHSLWPMVVAAAGGAGYFALQHFGAAKQPSFLEFEAMSLPFMLIGTAFHYHFAGGLRTPGLCVATLALVGLFVVLFRISPASGGAWTTAGSYGFALSLFGIAYAARRLIPDWGILRLLARISFPLYAVHLLASFSLMTWLIAGPLRLPYEWASSVAFVVVLLIAWLLHQGVERRTIAWGAALGRPRGKTVPAAELAIG